LGSNIAAIFGPIITLLDLITAKGYVNKLGNQAHTTCQTLFPSNESVLQDDSAPVHTAGTVHSLLEEHEGELQHLPLSAETPDFNITELLWPVLETGMRNRFPPPTSLQQFEDVLQEEWHKIPLQTVQNL
jgi:hypothetical protein